ITAKNGSRQVAFLVVMSVFLFISYVTVTLRQVYCRHFYLKVVGLDDLIMVGALGATTGMAIMNGFHVSLGTGRHLEELPLLEILIPTLNHCTSKPQNAWSLTFPQGCNDVAASYYSMSTINVVTDVVILIMPLPTLATLHINTRRRLALIGIFSTGGVAILASCLRFYALHVYAVTKDPSYDAIYILLWSQIEVNLAIISASAPALRPLFKKTFAGSS
ncbi:hypothetical protein DL95DRAFT_248214, partial [Leptodontidium sp. 2 PMI_412]